MRLKTQEYKGLVMHQRIWFLIFVFCLLTSAVCADWPTYMHDNTRSGITSETLYPDELDEAWVYTSPAPPQVAWDGGQPWDSYAGVTQVPMRDFDFVFFVTVVGDSIYFGSSVTDSVYCLDARTGAQNWRFTVNGPVRYPPSYYGGRLYFGCDDGYVYCIEAEDGTFVWKYSPNSDTRLIGNNNSFIPMWPVRTGTAIADGKVYFASSLVNWQSSYLCSVDSLTGSDSGTGLYKTSGGVTPMGAIMLSPTKIYLLQGRMYPYVFDRASGSNLGTFGKYGDGGCYALLTSDSSFVHGLGQDHQSGDELREYDAEDKDQIASHPDGRRLIVSSGTAYLLTNDTLAALSRTNGQTSWSISTDCCYALILADDILFAGGTNKVCAYSAANGEELWNRTVAGRVRGLAASDGRLFASTDAGNIYMFGPSYLASDFDKSGTVGLSDLIIFANDYLKCTDPTNPVCENLLE